MADPLSKEPHFECNECDWKGPLSATVRFKHGTIPLCPECRETLHGPIEQPPSKTEVYTGNLVRGLRDYAKGLEKTDRGDWCIKAADEIERLTHELEQERGHADRMRGQALRLRAALGDIFATTHDPNTVYKARKALGLADETAAMHMVVCTCQVITGGHVVHNPKCEWHADKTNESP